MKVSSTRFTLPTFKCNHLFPLLGFRFDVLLSAFTSSLETIYQVENMRIFSYLIPRGKSVSTVVCGYAISSISWFNMFLMNAHSVWSQNKRQKLEDKCFISKESRAAASLTLAVLPVLEHTWCRNAGRETEDETIENDQRKQQLFAVAKRATHGFLNSVFDTVSLPSWVALLLLPPANAWDQWSRRRIRRRIRAKELSKLVARFTPWVGSKRARFSMRAKAARGRLSGDGRKRALRHPMHDVNPNPSTVWTKVDRLTLSSHSP